MDILAVILLNVLALPIQELLSELLGVPQLPDLWLIFIVSVICWIVKYRKKFLTKQSWTSDIWIVEVIEKCLIWLWVIYLIIQRIKDEKSIFFNLYQVISELIKLKTWNINFLLFLRPIFILSIVSMVVIGCLFVYRSMRKQEYKELHKLHEEGIIDNEFSEYKFVFQYALVKFLNKENQFGQNIYWLDGDWGTGKTYFIRTFFEKQRYKVREIYYISCFGIKTRGQAEQVLLSEIEAHSRLGVFSNIPVIGSLISWGFNASGLGLMKKDAILIFDDLERVVYNPVNNENGTEDNPADYNDLLGFIDYLANHKNQKVIVIYNSKEIAITQRTIIEQKFAPIPNVIDIPIMIDRICREDSVLNYSIKTYLANFYELKWYISRTNVLRELQRDITKCQDGQMVTGDFVIDLNKIIESRYIQDTFKRIEDYIKKDLMQYSPYELLKLKIEFKFEPNNYYYHSSTYYEYIEHVKLIHFSWISYIKVLSEFKNMTVQENFKFKFIRTDGGLVQHVHDFSDNLNVQQILNEEAIEFTVMFDDWKKARVN